MNEQLLNDGHKAVYRTPGFGPTALFCWPKSNEMTRHGAWEAGREACQ